MRKVRPLSNLGMKMWLGQSNVLPYMQSLQTNFSYHQVKKIKYLCYYAKKHEENEYMYIYLKCCVFCFTVIV